jgi:DNA-binding MarR family transcriptional regulator
MSDQPDFVESLGALTLDHRFKRMLNRLLEEADDIYRALGLPIKARWCSTLLLLEREESLTVTEVAERLQLSHPAVVQSLEDMAGTGLVRKVQDPLDGRRRLLSLSVKGKRWMPRLHEVWAEMSRAQARVFARADCDMLSALAAANAALDRKNIATRVLERVRCSDTKRPARGRTSQGELQ